MWWGIPEIPSKRESLQRCYRHHYQRRRSCRAVRRTPKSPPSTPAAGAAPWRPPGRHLHVSSPVGYFAQRGGRKRAVSFSTANKALEQLVGSRRLCLRVCSSRLARSAAQELEPRGRRRFSAALTSPLHGWCLVAVVLPLSPPGHGETETPPSSAEGIWGVAAESQRRRGGFLRRLARHPARGPSAATGLGLCVSFLRGGPEFSESSWAAG